MPQADLAYIQQEINKWRGTLTLSIDNHRNLRTAAAWQKALPDLSPDALCQPFKRLWPNNPGLQIEVTHTTHKHSTKVEITPDPEKLVTHAGISFPCCSTFTVIPNASIRINHAFLPVEEQQAGTGTKILRKELEIAEHYNCKKATLHASDEAGAYTWVRMGFKPDNTDWELARMNIHDRVKIYEPGNESQSHLHGKNPPAKDDAHYALALPHKRAFINRLDTPAFFITKTEYTEIIRQLEKPDSNGAFVFANILDRVVGKTKDDKDIKLGQVLLCGEVFEASLPLDPGHVQYKQMLHYTNERLRSLGQKPEATHEKR